MSGTLGANIPDSFKEPLEDNLSATSTRFSWGSATSVKVSESNIAAQAKCYEVAWDTPRELSVLEDCFDIEDGVYWYGGPEEFTQHFPLRPGNSRGKLPYLPGDMIQDQNIYYGGVTEPYWLSSNGVAIWVPEGSFLHYSWNADGRKMMCLSAEATPPYPCHSGIKNVSLTYMICEAGDPKSMHLAATNSFLGKPSGIPDLRMMKEPIWSTWARYKADINQSTVMEFAKEIYEYGLPASQIEIDDKWETCYGTAEFDQDKFPNAKKLVKDLADKYNFRTTLWVHPFINTGCVATFAEAFKPNQYLVRSTKRIPGNKVG